jgi:hypothetical protein
VPEEELGVEAPPSYVVFIAIVPKSSCAVGPFKTGKSVPGTNQGSTLGVWKNMQFTFPVKDTDIT